MIRPMLVLTLVAVVVGCGSGGSLGPVASTDRPSPTAIPTRATTPEPTLADLLERERMRNAAPGMLALVRRDDDALWATAGTADVEGTSITASTRFRIGSITKPIVAALVLTAVDDGRFALDDDVGGLLPGVLRDEPAVTVRQLLDHTSGIFDEGNEGDVAGDIDRIADPVLRSEAQDLRRAYEAGESVMLPDRVWVALAETHERYFAPGTDIHYSNVNYQVLGMILERVTGASLASQLKEEIADPLRLVFTSVTPPDDSTPDMHGYEAGGPGSDLVDVTSDTAWFGNGGSGGIISTADELLAIMTAIVTGALLGDDLAAQMRTPSLEDYGLGLATFEFSCGTFYGHGGSVLGTQSIALVSDDGRDGAVVALNIHSEMDPQLPVVADALLCWS